ncbi:MAG: hypothetical protein GF349_00465 [Candidatus Magasanikbacteria bacterium]|nr:hypothetical protein [Candidatus Magasanikbacteria bacterium]
MAVDKIKNLTEFDNHHEVLTFNDGDLHAFVAIHSKCDNQPSFGATRFWHYDSPEEALQEALRLSRTMSFKCSMADLPYGGAKAVIMSNGVDTPEKRKDVFKKYAKKIDELGGIFVTGSDVGVNKDDLNIMCSTSQYIIGGEVPAGYFTALGVFYAIEVVLEEIFGTHNFSDKSFAIQGLGKTGLELLKLLYERGAKIYVSDINSTLVDKTKNKYPNIIVEDSENIHKLDVDIFCPCALSHAINNISINEINCRGVAGAANSQLQNDSIGLELHRKGIIYAPDYISNSGGFISVVDEYQYGVHSTDRIINKLSNIKKNLKNIFLQSKQEDLPVSQLANQKATEKLCKIKVPENVYC